MKLSGLHKLKTINIFNNTNFNCHVLNDIYRLVRHYCNIFGHYFFVILTRTPHPSLHGLAQWNCGWMWLLSWVFSSLVDSASWSDWLQIQYSPVLPLCKGKSGQNSVHNLSLRFMYILNVKHFILCEKFPRY